MTHFVLYFAEQFWLLPLCVYVSMNVSMSLLFICDNVCRGVCFLCESMHACHIAWLFFGIRATVCVYVCMYQVVDFVCGYVGVYVFQLCTHTPMYT